ncbi:DUF3943 domain-containing protein [Sediminibacterium roseum]|uniref:DUF3943 domain-containing protein n=1 Tax=Sediminibacterium roseum TaxID=1978412 RepID=A0ABW9ZVQ3_9BACT|nr:DUF3943 domain-containing protein [Sediminibacterium roseum]NCI50098.1 DUF3943 domain-containing protein [Sediminibacterium roseum]
MLVLSADVQDALTQQVFYPTPPSDSIAKIPLVERPRRKRFGRGALELALAEAVPFSFNRYVQHTDFAQVDWQSTGHNLNPANWRYDSDDFGTNNFSHPYHGSLYYNSFRSNGYSFWQSVPATAIGSYIWETFGENEAPSPNDFINTTFGGIVLGEMTHRLANKIVNNRRRGFRRQVNEVVAFLINPMNGLNRIIDGRWGRRMNNSVETDSSKIYAEFDIGQRKFNTGNQVPPRFGWYGHIKFLYGTPFQNYRKPFSNISINVEAGHDDSSLINVVSVYGSLAGWEIIDNERMQSYAILSANYDYIHNEAFFYGAQSVKINIISNYGLMRKAKISTAGSAGITLLAAIPDAYKYGIRPYDYGSGINISGSAGLSLLDKFYFGINYGGGWVVTLNGNPSHYYLHTVTSEARYTFMKNLSACVEPGYFTLRGHYKDLPDVNKSYPYLRVSLRYHLNARQLKFDEEKTTKMKQ